ncbi:MAG TPA: GNAT family N-acetyltransferase [Gaiellaceae bacterium]|nr:GNAT family N-acetyltransferase [Gaiellaceae bacterium]
MEVVRDVILRDGTTLRLRAPREADREGVLAFFARLSPESLHSRFHGLPTVDARLVQPFLAPDWDERGDLIATLGAEGGERVVAHAGWVRLRDVRRAEVAFAVEDALQGRGVGTRLLEQLADTAGDAGVTEFVAEVLPENTAMLTVFQAAGFEVRRTLAQGEIEVRFPIAATEAYRAAVAARDHEAVVASLRPFFAPSSVAVLGASPRAGSIGNTVVANIVAAGFEGTVLPVNRSGDPVAGLTAHRSLAEAATPVDLAVVCLPAEHVLAGVEEALVQGVRAFCVISAGFAEVGPEGREREELLLELVRRHGARLIGPNCLGIAVTAARLNATFAPHPFPPGPIGFSSQSGALGLALLEEATARGLGFSAFVSVGNKADVSSNDLLEYWEDDPDTGLVLLYLESFGNPRKFGRIAGRLARRKPVLAVKSGVTRAGARAASSHTAALAGSEKAVEALFRQAGVVRAGSLEELVDTAMALSRFPLPAGPRVALLTNAGGLGILCADACEGAGLELAGLSAETAGALRAQLPAAASVANPVDVLGSATAAGYGAALPPIVADPGVDAVLVLFVPAASTRSEDVLAAIEAVDTHGKPVVPVVVAAERPPGTYPYPESAARALARAVERSAWLRRPAGSVPPRPEVDAAAAAEIVGSALAGADDVWLPPAEARALLAAYGVPLVPEQVVGTVDEAVVAAVELGLPAVVKTAEAGVHKTERAGVALDLESEEEVRAAAERIGPPLVVQPMIAGGVELLAGVVQDPVFGPLVAFGPGGVLAELIGDAGFRIAPLTDADAEELVLGGKAGRLVRGFRGRPAADADALTSLVHRLAALAEDRHEVAELDLNPVLGLPRGCVAVDARVRLRRPEAAPRLKTW